LADQRSRPNLNNACKGAFSVRAVAQGNTDHLAVRARVNRPPDDEAAN